MRNGCETEKSETKGRPFVLLTQNETSLIENENKKGKGIKNEKIQNEKTRICVIVFVGACVVRSGGGVRIG
jgi:hypothetical protein